MHAMVATHIYFVRDKFRWIVSSRANFVSINCPAKRGKSARALVEKYRGGCGPVCGGNRTLLYFHEINSPAVSVMATVNGSPWTMKRNVNARTEVTRARALVTTMPCELAGRPVTAPFDRVWAKTILKNSRLMLCVKLPRRAHKGGPRRPTVWNKKLISALHSARRRDATRRASRVLWNFSCRAIVNLA